MGPWLLLIVMSLAVYRLTRLVVADTFPPIRWLRDRLVGGWRPLTDREQEQVRSAGLAYMAWRTTDIDGTTHRWVERGRRSPSWLAELLSCPWCASGWIALAVTGGVWAVAGLVMPVLVYFAVWAAGALLAGQEWA